MKQGLIPAVFLLACITSPHSFSAPASTACPSNQDAPKPLPSQISMGDIKSWLRTNETFTLIKHDDVILCDKETALIAQAEFENRGRNFDTAVILIRPQQHSAIELAAMQYEITNLSGTNNPTIVELTKEASGQGTLEGSIALVQFRGDRPILIHEQDYQDKSGACAENETCKSTLVEWSYETKDDGQILVEKIINSSTMNDKVMSHEQITNRYRYTLVPQFNKISQ